MPEQSSQMSNCSGQKQVSKFPCAVEWKHFLDECINPKKKSLLNARNLEAEKINQKSH